jgi:predicted amidophosphoribosyltransferase
MVCLVCHRLDRWSLCSECRLSLRPAPDRILPEGVRLIPAFEHTGAARELIHHLKYRGMTDYAELVAAVIAPRVPPLPLVPVPRALSRRLRYGIDPARVLANRLSTRTSAPVLPLFQPRLHTRRRAGGDHQRKVGLFRIRGPAPDSLLLVDDVVTTGATVEAAIRSLGQRRVVAVIAANAAAG